MHWLLCLDHSLQFATSAGLGRFLQTDEEDPLRKMTVEEMMEEPSVQDGNQPLLVVSSDQGGGGFQARSID